MCMTSGMSNAQGVSSCYECELRKFWGKFSFRSSNFLLFTRPDEETHGQGEAAAMGTVGAAERSVETTCTVLDTDT